jgi:hypothetical protein
MIGDTYSEIDSATGAVLGAKIDLTPMKVRPTRAKAMKFDLKQETRGEDSTAETEEAIPEEDSALKAYRKRIGIR